MVYVYMYIYMYIYIYVQLVPSAVFVARNNAKSAERSTHLMTRRHLPELSTVRSATTMPSGHSDDCRRICTSSWLQRHSGSENMGVVKIGGTPKIVDFLLTSL